MLSHFRNWVTDSGHASPRGSGRIHRRVSIYIYICKEHFAYLYDLKATKRRRGLTFAGPVVAGASALQTRVYERKKREFHRQNETEGPR